MIEINKPVELIKVQCYRCKTIMHVHPKSNLNRDYFSRCELHNETKPQQNNDQWSNSEAGVDID